MSQIADQTDKTNGPETFYIKSTRTLLSYLEDLGEYGPVLQIQPQYTFLDDGGYQYDIKAVADYAMRLTIESRLHNRFSQMEDVVRCARKLWEAGILQPPPFIYLDEDKNPVPTPSFEHIKDRLIEDLLFAVNDFYVCYDTFQPSDEQILEHYHRLKDLWLRPTIRYDIELPLENFDSNFQKKYNISPRLVLSPFTHKEKTRLWNERAAPNPTMIMPISTQQLSRMNFKLSGIQEQEKENGSAIMYNLSLVMMEMGYILTSLRLLKRGYVGIPAIFVKAYVHSPTHLPYSHLQLDNYRSVQAYPRYLFDQKDIKSLASTIALLQKLPAVSEDKPYGEMTIALRRFNQIYTRDLREDQIIDLTIALESALLPGDVSSSKKENLSPRGAQFITKNQNQQDDIQILLDLMYDARNSIVHGGLLLQQCLPECRKKFLYRRGSGKVRHQLYKHKQPPSYLQSAEDFYQHCENTTRNILLKIVPSISKHGNLQTVIQKLEAGTL